MENHQNNREYFAIDLAHIVRTLWHRAWIILMAGILAAGIGFGVSAFLIEPSYSSSVLLYVNTNSISVGGISLNDLTASKSLVQTYTVLLKNRTTLEAVKEAAGVEYPYETLYHMIEAGAVNGTEVLRVTVTSRDPHEAARIANSIADEMALKLPLIVEGSSMKVVDKAIPNLHKVSPSITRNTVLAMLIGICLSSAIIAVLAALDDTIHNEEYILQTYDYPILAKVPNLLGRGAKTYGRYGYSARTEL